MTIDPFEPLKVLIIGLCALALGGVVGGVPAYYVGKAHQAEKSGEAIGSLKTSVESCSTAAQKANELVATERQASDAREQRMAAALEANARARPQYRAASDRAMSYQPKGDSECARTVDTVRALVMGGGR